MSGSALWMQIIDPGQTARSFTRSTRQALSATADDSAVGGTVTLYTHTVPSRWRSKAALLGAAGPYSYSPVPLLPLLLLLRRVPRLLPGLPLRAPALPPSSLLLAPLALLPVLRAPRGGANLGLSGRSSLSSRCARSAAGASPLPRLCERAPLSSSPCGDGPALCSGGVSKPLA